jgi:hypothetical protein
MNPFWPQGVSLEVDVDSTTTEGEPPGSGAPRSFRWEARSHHVQETSAHWRVHTSWWTDNELWRDYWEVATDSGLLCILYQDLLAGDWYLERIYQ